MAADECEGELEVVRGFCRVPGEPLCGLLGEPCCVAGSNVDADCFDPKQACDTTFGDGDAVCVACGGLGEVPCDSALQLTLRMHAK